MANKAGRLGTVGENGALKLLQKIWPYAERRRLSGAADKGDIAPGGVPPVPIAIEVKNAKTLNFSGWLKEAEEERKNAGAKYGIVIAKRRGYTDAGKWYAMMDGDTLVALLKEAGYSYDA